MITVGELKLMLDEYDDNRIVVIATDGEGNSFSPLDNVGWGVYFADSTWVGDFVDADDLEADEDINTDESEPAIVLWPAN